jgi:RNA polymerase sigma factor (sigma-70 family)|tara:strand:+ start:399 stop:1160 length:762 start_codon:yes stop_codon:yes gene_type:complete
MKKYNVQNYIRYKEDVKDSQPQGKMWDEYTRDELIIKFLPLVENIGRKFSTSQEASGVMSIMDIMQAGSIGLILAVDKLDFEDLLKSDDIERTLKSFLAKRIKGTIRRSIDHNRGDIRIPEHKLNEIRKDNGKDRKLVEMFFNSIFLSIDAVKRHEDSDGSWINNIPDKSEPYNTNILNAYLKSLLKKHLNDMEYQVLRLSYGLDCDKKSAKEIARKLNIKGVSAYVRVSELKKQAVEKLINNVDHSQVIDYL